MMKWLGLLLIVCSGGGIGFLYAMRLRQERTNLERLCQMLREIAVQIAFRRNCWNSFVGKPLMQRFSFR